MAAPKPKDIFARLFSKNKATEARPQPSQPSEQPSSNQSAALRRRFERMAWTHWLHKALAASLLVTAFSLACVYFAFSTIKNRPSFVLESPPPMDLAQERWMGSKAESLDELVSFLFATVPPLQFLDDSGNPQVALLQGAVAPSILDRTNARVERNRETARKQLIIQTLVPVRVTDIVEDPESGKIAALFRGYIVTVIQGSNKFVTQPYRARVVVSRNTPNRVNFRRFYLERLEERFGRDAADWDGQSEPSTATPSRSSR